MLELPPVYIQPCLPASRSDVISLEDLENYEYLSGVELPRIDSDVGVLIGANAPKAMEPWDVIPSVDNGPFAVKTLLGLVIIRIQVMELIIHSCLLMVSMQKSCPI